VETRVRLTAAKAMVIRLLSVHLMLSACSVAAGAALEYQGTWHTTNRKLDGRMTCVVTPIAKHEWEGRFYGTWQGVDFDYTVDFTGPASDLRGTATIDGASYKWKGRIDRKRFKGSFSGDRYKGSFDLKRKTNAFP
jgi:hypothetical protein